MQTRAKATSDRLIARHGGAASLVRPAPQPVNPWDAPAGAPSLVAVTFLETGATDDHMAGGLIRAGDVLGVVTGAVPDLADHLRWRGRDHAIQSIHPVQPDGGGPAVHWRIHARA